MALAHSVDTRSPSIPVYLIEAGPGMVCMHCGKAAAYQTIDQAFAPLDALCLEHTKAYGREQTGQERITSNDPRLNDG